MGLLQLFEGTTMVVTTLNKIRSYRPCQPSWEVLLKALGKTKDDAEPLSLLFLLDTLGLRDTVWCLRAVEGHEKEKRLFAVFCARQVQHRMKDKRSITAINIAEKFANGEASQEDLQIAYNAAYDAAYDAYVTYVTYATYDTYAAAYAASAAAYAASAAAYDASAYAAAASATAAIRKDQETELRKLLSA